MAKIEMKTNNSPSLPASGSLPMHDECNERDAPLVSSAIAGQSLLDRTFASSYPTTDEIDPDDEVFAMRAAVEILQQAKGQDVDEKIGGRELIDRIKEAGSILSLRDVARVLHRAWREKIIHRALDQPHLRDTRHSFVYWVDETNVTLASFFDGFARDNATDDLVVAPTHSDSITQDASIMGIVIPSASEANTVHWTSLDGRKTPMQGIKLADIPAGESAYAHLQGVARRSYARNFKNVTGADRVLVFNEEKACFYAPAIHVLDRQSEPLESKKAVVPDERLTVSTPENQETGLAQPAALETRAPAFGTLSEAPAAVEPSPAVIPLRLEACFLRSVEAAMLWRMKTGKSWPDEFMTDLIEQAVREARQVERERAHHRAVRRVVLAQTDMLRAAILLDEGAEAPLAPVGESSFSVEDFAPRGERLQGGQDSLIGPDR